MGLIGKLGKRKRSLGVDIGSASVKVLELSVGNGGFRVESCALEALPPNAVVEGNISDVEGVGEALKRARARSGCQASRAALALGGPGVIARTITLDASLSDTDMLKRIVDDADRYVPYPLDEVAIDVEVRGLSEQHPDQAEVLLVACRKNDIDRLGAVLDAARLEPTVVEPEGQALERVFQLLLPRLDRQAGELVVAVADIGATNTTLWVLVDGRAVFSRGQPFGGRELVKDIQERYSLPYKEAENAARRGDLTPDFEDSVLRPFNGETARHLARSLRFFYSSTHYSDVDRILLIGGAAVTRGLPHALQNALQAPASVVDPFAGMSMSTRVDAASLAADAPALALCCGLAMRSLQ
ncbi:MAG: type IV pilus assembly protein PilM [Gammaproteobacteria bacterium]|nr:type IV pilus assembly protein PilM [Gammaproteobacteria bacterium]